GCYVEDIAVSEAALDTQRRRSQEERKSKRLTVDVGGLDTLSDWEVSRGASADALFVGDETVEIDTLVTAVKHLPDGRVAMLLRESPFYAESGGQISDHGEIIGDGWRVD